MKKIINTEESINTVYGTERMERMSKAIEHIQSIAPTADSFSYLEPGKNILKKGEIMKKLIETLSFGVVALAIVYANLWFITAIIRLVRG